MTADDYTYDVFISYSHKDSQWVKNWLLPRLEDVGLDVIIDFRDFEIGVPSIVNMENAVQKSRHVLQELEKHIGQHDDLLVYEQQLRENMADARRFGDTADKRSERARIVSQLNRLALDAIGVSFNELCGN